jgi:hypothetical protein
MSVDTLHKGDIDDDDDDDKFRMMMMINLTANGLLPSGSGYSACT